MKTPLLLTLVAGLASPLLAQQPPPPPPPGQGPAQSQNQNQGQGQEGQGQNQGGRRPPPPPPLLRALDTNHDGVISADEIAAASTSLKTLDRNGDGQLTREEFGPPRRGPQGNPDSSQDSGNGN